MPKKTLKNSSDKKKTVAKKKATASKIAVKTVEKNKTVVSSKPIKANGFWWFWTRHMAFVIDIFLVGFVLANTSKALSAFGILNPFLIPHEQMMYIFFLLVGLYFTFGHYFFGRTLWKFIVWVKVIDNQWGKVGLLQSLWRFIAKIISITPLFIWCIWAGIDRKKRSFHDLLSWTEVIETGKMPAFIVILFNILFFVAIAYLISLALNELQAFMQDPELLQTIQAVESLQ